MRSGMEDAMAGGLARLFLVEEEHELILREAELSWVRGLVREIRGGTLGGLRRWEAFHSAPDAMVLAICLRDVPNTEEAFAAYERIRKKRVEKVVEFARRMGNQKSPSGAFGRMVRDLVLLFFLKMGVKATEPVYPYRVAWDEKIATA